MSNERMNYTAFVPNGDSRKDTLTILLGTAAEHGLDARNIKSSPSRDGFRITDELADVLYEDDQPTDTSDEAPAPKAKKKKE